MEAQEIQTTEDVVVAPGMALVPYDREADSEITPLPPSILAILEDEFVEECCGNCCDSNCDCF